MSTFKFKLHIPCEYSACWMQMHIHVKVLYTNRKTLPIYKDLKGARQQMHLSSLAGHHCCFG